MIELHYTKTYRMAVMLRAMAQSLTSAQLTIREKTTNSGREYYAICVDDAGAVVRVAQMLGELSKVYERFAEREGQ